jgi:hypothetical protein
MHLHPSKCRLPVLLDATAHSPSLKHLELSLPLTLYPIPGHIHTPSNLHFTTESKNAQQIYRQFATHHS